MLVDSHCHLDFPQFDVDRKAVLERAATAGVHRIINPGIDLETSQRAVELAALHETVYAMVGVHPYGAESVDESTLNRLRTLAQEPEVVAIGEIGLDYYRGDAPKEVQITAFQQQLDLAAELGQPVAIHQRAADEDVRRVLSKWVEGMNPDPYKGRLRGVLHAFSGDLSLAEAAREWRFLVGLGGPLTFRNAKELQQAARVLPLSQVIVETDAPYLTPHPYRGRRNEPQRVALVAQALTGLLNLPLDKVVDQTTDNAKRLFGIE